MMKRYRAYVEVPNDGGNGIAFVVMLKNGSRFKLNGCYFTICKELFEKYPDSDFFQIDVVTEEDKKSAENIMKRAIDLLVYITGIPYELSYLREDADINILPINVSMSKKKLERLRDIDQQYDRIKRKKELLENVLRWNALATKYTIILEDAEEAYFAMFRVLEKIAKDEFGIEHGSIDNGYNSIRSMIRKITKDIYGIKIASNKLDDLAGNFAAGLMDAVFSDVYAKIAWFCQKKGISYDEEILARAVILRNKLAHGENVNIDYMMDEYTLVSKLSHKFIHKKFFANIKDCYLEAKIVD